MGSKRTKTRGQAASRARKRSNKIARRLRYQQIARERGIPEQSVPSVLFHEGQAAVKRRATEEKERSAGRIHERRQYTRYDEMTYWLAS